MLETEIEFSWYGHCCFLIKTKKSRILLDPYDHFLNIRLGEIKADQIIISSIWHDHANIAAAPQALIYASKGKRELKNNITIHGIESKETRGSSNTIFNLQYQNISLTNFADWGDPRSLKQMSQKEKSILKNTDVAFMRFNTI